MAPLAQPQNDLIMLATTPAWPYIVGLSLIPRLLLIVIYQGLSMLESGRASIAATIEPVIAVLLGMLVLGDNLTLWQGIGIIFILAAVIGIQFETAETIEKA